MAKKNSTNYSKAELGRRGKRAAYDSNWQSQQKAKETARRRKELKKTASMQKSIKIKPISGVKKFATDSAGSTRELPKPRTRTPGLPKPTRTNKPKYVTKSVKTKLVKKLGRRVVSGKRPVLDAATLAKFANARKNK